MIRRIKVILIDENDLHRTEFEKLLRMRSFDVIFSKRRGQSGIHKLVSLEPDLAIVDFKTTRIDSIDIANEIKMLFPDIKLIFHSLYYPTAHLSMLKTIGEGLIVKQAFEVDKGLALIAKVMKYTRKEIATGDLPEKEFQIHGLPQPEYTKMISDKALAAISNNKIAIPLLMAAFGREENAIREWLVRRDPILITPKAISTITKLCQLREDEVAVPICQINNSIDQDG